MLTPVLMYQKGDPFCRVASILYRRPVGTVSVDDRNRAARAIHDVMHNKRRSMDEVLDILIGSFPHADEARQELRVLIAPVAMN
jgi:hypothetical protein